MQLTGCPSVVLTLDPPAASRLLLEVSDSEVLDLRHTVKPLINSTEITAVNVGRVTSFYPDTIDVRVIFVWGLTMEEGLHTTGFRTCKHSNNFCASPHGPRN